MVPRRARPIPSYLAPEPFNPEHTSVTSPLRQICSRSCVLRASVSRRWLGIHSAATRLCCTWSHILWRMSASEHSCVGRRCAHFVTAMLSIFFFPWAQQVVDILSVTVGCDGCADGCSVHFSPVGLLWARHPGEDAKRPFGYCCARHLIFRARNLNCLKAAIGV